MKITSQKRSVILDIANSGSFCVQMKEYYVIYFRN